jgi:hypothetical protein
MSTYIKRGGKYPEDAVVYDTESNTFYPLGGGFAYKAGEKFFEDYRPWDMKTDGAPIPWRPGVFTIDGLPEFHGFTRGFYWNGWEMPYFTKETAARVLEASEGYEWRYNTALDAFHVTVSGEPEGEEEVFYGTETSHGVLYGIGAGSWTWDKL